MSTQAANLQFDVMSYLMRDQVRLLGPTETIPASLDAGFELLGQLDRDWIWVIAGEGRVKGILLASPCHGAAFIWRLAVEPGLDNVAVVRLLRGFLRDIKSRGLVGYLTIVDAAKPIQKRLQGIIEKAGGKQHGEFTLMLGPVRDIDA